MAVSFLPLIHELCVTMFAGVALYINVAEHPARMTIPIEYAVSQWAPSYKKAAMLQASLAMISILGGLISFLISGGSQYLISALLMAFVFGFTMTVIMPVNKKLLSLKTMEEKKQKQVETMLIKWNRLHAVRTIAALTAVFILYAAKIKQ